MDVPESLLRLAILGVVLVALRALFRGVASAPKRRLNRSLVLYLLYAAAIAAGSGAAQVGLTRTARYALFAGDLMAVLLVINLAAVTVFDLVLRRLRIGYPDILHDLTVGAAYLVALVWSMKAWGFNLTSIVATSAVVTAVIGLSLQSTLGNVIGGLALQVDDSIREGDWVELDNKMQGQVKKVRWRHTVIETRDSDTIIVPNGQLLNQTLKVLGKREGRPTQHRMHVYFNVDHRFAPGEVIRTVREAMTAAPIPAVSQQPPPDVVCLDLARERRDSYCYYSCRYHLLDMDRDESTSSLVRERIYAALKRAQIPLALPAHTVFLNHEDQKAEKRRERSLDEMRRALREVDLFSRLSADELDRLADSGTLAPFVAGEVVTKQGAAAHWLYVLIRGEVEVLVAKDDGIERHVAVVKAPGFFGEMALVTGAAREATVIAREDIECLRVDKDDFREVLAGRPELAQDISQVLAQRRVALETVRENLDADQRSRRVQSEKKRILAAIRDFFGMGD